jgi:hypothetical protein
MKHTLLLFLFICSFICHADFDDAINNYAEKNYAAAFAEFEKLAKIGNKRAQFNLAVMYLHGEFVPQDNYLAYGWGKLSEHEARPEFSQIAKTLTSQFDSHELAQAEKTYTALVKQFGEAKIYAKLSPIVYHSDDEKSSDAPRAQIDIVKRFAPRYPKDAFNKRIQGWVTVKFDIYPDGSVRNPYIADAYPENHFENETLRAIQYFKFDVSYPTGTEPYPVAARQTIEYTLEKMVDKKVLRKTYDERLEQLKDLAGQGSPKAQYLYAIAARSNLLNNDNKITKQEANEWLLKAAQNGHLDAQFLLGKNILNGEGCQVEKQKAIDWIVYAAEQGHPRSSRTAFSLLTDHDNLNNTNKPAEYWLKMAAEKGDADAQIDFAEFLVNQHNPTLDDLILARKYLDMYAEQRTESIKWYQVSAEVYQLQGNSKKAAKDQKKADKLAKKFGWEV